MGSRNPLDRSAAHEALLGYYEPFKRADLFETSDIITAFLADFYASGSKDMGAFARTWNPSSPPAPAPRPASRQARAEVRDGLMHVRKN